MNEHPTEFADLMCQPLCLACSGETRALYVYLRSGNVIKIGNANSISLTNDDLIIPCGDGESMNFKRAEVYFTSCEKVSPPPPS